VTWLSDEVLAHLCKVADWPDMTGTRYDVVEKIGQGGMGAVFRAHDRELDRAVAVKVLHAPPENGATQDRMVKEARILARLEHPSIVPVHDSGVLPDGRFFYAMKLVQGKRLDEGKGSATPLAERLRLFQKLCDAVAFAHAHGVIHRDLKPQNVMLGPFGEVLVMDWGVAKERDDRPRPPEETVSELDRRLPSQTEHGTVVGTPGYMAPEQERGETHLVDERSDVFALGAILRFLLMAKESNAEAVPQPLKAIVSKATASDRSARYGSVTLLATDIADFLAGRRVSAYPEGFKDTVLRLGRKYRTVLVLISTYVIVRILMLVFLHI
jgi:eukaryotic-like serine/threonine-protein kinase